MIIDKEHFDYLVIQHGKVSDHRDHFMKWKQEYEKSLTEIFESIKPVLPAKCESVLDIGSGLGGIDILTARHYSPPPKITLLDGMDDPPMVRNSFQTFNNARVAINFHRKNNNEVQVVRDVPREKFDLIYSFFAYGFHIPPEDYLESVVHAAHSTTVLVFDVRKSKKEWLRQFVLKWPLQPKVLFNAEKYVRLAFNAI